MLIDCHVHWIPPALADLLRRRDSPPCLRRSSAGEALVTQLGARPFDPASGDLDLRIEQMGRDRIDLQVLSLSGLFGVDSLPLDESVPLVEAYNAATLAAQRAFPDRFLGLAALPLADIGRAAGVLEAACRAGLRGAILPAEGFRTAQAAAAFAPVLAVAQRLPCHFFIHPGGASHPTRSLPAPNGDGSSWLRQGILQTQATLSEALVTLVAGDLLQPYPHATVQVANLGGTLPLLGERIESFCLARGRASPLPSGQAARCLVDTASFGPRAIAMAAAFWGPDSIVFGSDSPIFDAARAARALAAAGLARADLQRVRSGNAAELLLARRAVPC
jgi:predicted TIM-barrel fold metal-dependent hydrolase